MITNTSIILDAFAGANTKVPVWFMRQAGRYLPEYQAIRKKYPLEEMFLNPEIASEVTCQPVDILGVDAAILFADILTLPKAMGIDITFDSEKGPVIAPITSLKNLHTIDDIPYIRKTIELVNQALPPNTPLIGFAGSPFTVLTYLIEGGSSVNFSKTLKLIYSDTKTYHELMEMLTQNTITYYKLQKDSGIKIFQLFDTWAGILSKPSYDEYVLPYIRKIFSSITMPSIYFVKNCSHLIESMDTVDADFLSVCHTVSIGSDGLLLKTDKGIQGNLFPGILFDEEKKIRSRVRALLTAAKKHKKYIFNLSHGLLPNIEVDKVRCAIDEAHHFLWKE